MVIGYASMFFKLISPLLLFNHALLVFADRIGALPLLSGDRFSVLRPGDVFLVHAGYFLAECLLIGLSVWVYLENGPFAAFLSFFGGAAIFYLWVTFALRLWLEILLYRDMKKNTP